MKLSNLLPFLFLLLFLAPPSGNAAGSMLRVSCEGDDVGAEVLINDKFRGECPIDLQVPEGALKLLVRKKADGGRERVFEQDIRMGDGAVKKVEARLGAAKLSAAEKARRNSNQIRLSKISFDAVQKEAASGSAEAMVALWARYGNGDAGTEKNEKLSHMWLLKAAEAGDVHSMFVIGLFYSVGKGDMPKSDEQAIQWYRKAAAGGDVQSMVLIGNSYERGKGVPQNDVAAMQWYRKAADAGSAEGAEKLGTGYLLGQGVPKSYEQAVVWFRKGAEVDDENDGGRIFRSGCMSYLGDQYEAGRGVAQDEQQAVYWWRKAAEGEYPNESAVEAIKKRGLR
jgi:TPR repeat protein